MDFNENMDRKSLELMELVTVPKFLEASRRAKRKQKHNGVLPKASHFRTVSRAFRRLPVADVGGDRICTTRGRRRRRGDLHVHRDKQEVNNCLEALVYFNDELFQACNPSWKQRGDLRVRRLGKVSPSRVGFHAPELENELGWAAFVKLMLARKSSVYVKN